MKSILLRAGVWCALALTASMEVSGQTVVRSREETLFVGPERVPCMGVGPMSCFQISTNAQGPWLLHYGEIGNLEFEAGLFHEVRVRREELDYGAPVADAPSFRYVAVEVVRRWSPREKGGLAQLTAGEWVLRACENLHLPGPLAVAAPGRPVITLALKSDGRISGSAGCNRYMGQAQVDDARVFVPGPLSTTRMACPFEQMQAERDFVESMSKVVRYTITEKELRLFDRAGSFALVFDRAPAAPAP